MSKTLPSSASVVVGNNMVAVLDKGNPRGGDLSLAVPRGTCACVFLSLLSYEPRSRVWWAGCIVGYLVDVKCKKEESSSCRLSRRSGSSGVPELRAPHVGLIQGPTLPSLSYTASLDYGRPITMYVFEFTLYCLQQPGE